MQRVCPAGDDRHGRIGYGHFIHHELGPGKESSHRSSDEKRPQHPVQKEEDAVGIRAQHIAASQLKFIRNRLQHETEQNKHPHPVGPAETGAVKERERGKERPAEHHQRGEGELPLAPGSQQQHTPLLFTSAQSPDERLPALHKHEKHQQRPKQCYKEPPIMLQQRNIVHIHLYINP